MAVRNPTTAFLSVHVCLTHLTAHAVPVSLLCTTAAAAAAAEAQPELPEAGSGPGGQGFGPRSRVQPLRPFVAAKGFSALPKEATGWVYEHAVGAVASTSMIEADFLLATSFDDDLLTQFAASRFFVRNSCYATLRNYAPPDHLASGTPPRTTI